MWRKGEKGAVAVEFALVLPPLLLVLFGITDFGIILYRQQVITTVSRDAARFAVAWPQPSKDEVEDRVKNQLSGYGLKYWDSDTFDYDNDGKDLTIEITYPLTFQVLSHFAPKFLASEIVKSGYTQKAQTTMRLE